MDKTDIFFGIIFIPVALTVLAMALSPFVASYLWAAGVIPWWGFALTVPVSLVSIALIALLWCFSRIRLFG
jgi:hypothetical protein